MYRMRFCYVRVITPAREVSVGLETTKTRALAIAAGLRKAASGDGLIIDVVSPVESIGSKVTSYCVVAAWEMRAGEWVKLADRDGRRIVGALDVYVPAGPICWKCGGAGFLRTAWVSESEPIICPVCDGCELIERAGEK